MKILIVRLSAFGDIIHCLPAMQDLLDRPEVEELHWLVDARYAFVCDILPRQVHIHSVAMKGDRPLQAIRQTARELRRIEFDAVLDLQGLIKSALLARASGSPVYGIDRRSVRERPAAWLEKSVCFHPEERHVVQQYRRVAAAPFADQALLARQPDAAISYALPHIDLAASRCQPDAALLTRLKLEGKRFVVLHAAGGWQTKQLPETTWLAIAEGAHAAGILPLFSWGSASERDLAQNLASRSNGCALPERLNMSGLSALLSVAKAVVGADTGLLHLAAALGTPTITFWGPSASWRSAPIGNEHGKQQAEQHWHIESNPPCGPCFRRTCDQFVCMDAVQPESVIRILHEL